MDNKSLDALIKKYSNVMNGIELSEHETVLGQLKYIEKHDAVSEIIKEAFALNIKMSQLVQQMKKLIDLGSKTIKPGCQSAYESLNKEKIELNNKKYCILRQDVEISAVKKPAYIIIKEMCDICELIRNGESGQQIAKRYGIFTHEQKAYDNTERKANAPR